MGLYGCAGKAREAVNGHSLDNERNAAGAALTIGDDAGNGAGWQVRFSYLPYGRWEQSAG